jgi:mono/diheme cytochrome c family protein
MRHLALILAAMALTGCDEMSHQQRYDSYEPSALFKGGKSMQSPADGTVARDDPAWSEALRERPALTLALLQRGHERYDIYCAPCHDAAGYGRGTIPSRGFPQPPSFHEARLREVTPDYIVDVITKGYGVMYSYTDRVAPSDRWAIAAYIRALQLSQAAPIASLSDEERAKLPGTP